jgi:hypothetical protein
LVRTAPTLGDLVKQARWDTPARHLVGYAANVKSLWGKGFALLGNAGEFLDPIFSSGVTIAFKSASLAARALGRQLSGECVDWDNDFAQPLKVGIDTFRASVDSWYAGKFQKIVFFDAAPPDVRRMITAILAGYAWDQANPYVREPKRRLAALEEFCALSL